uniref:Uncharacterized protein n=1 Tax=Chromera velia CCMP2878 TaxID=1169474 RepID=A0A0G4F509_9ALVE|eukprot:Cvel_149.t1-p1 / transcript=Cvel_149.t1 / gene=Cvel_149 / organism=Chromera_velia_CCMP2878 / gene_product=Translation initiation factor IF-2, putative / transcript_product=Translation initiation factor IF-2, putative / location=Cvel_scaffold10:20773-32245(+) / protein_length=3398 / sequence_SO=supercontig / SO=protein_coding / is_pseudo=false
MEQDVCRKEREGKVALSVPPPTRVRPGSAIGGATRALKQKQPGAFPGRLLCSKGVEAAEMEGETETTEEVTEGAKGTVEQRRRGRHSEKTAAPASPSFSSQTEDRMPMSPRGTEQALGDGASRYEHLRTSSSSSCKFRSVSKEESFTLSNAPHEQQRGASVVGGSGVVEGAHHSSDSHFGSMYSLTLLEGDREREGGGGSLMGSEFSFCARTGSAHHNQPHSRSRSGPRSRTGRPEQRSTAAGEEEEDRGASAIPRRGGEGEGREDRKQTTRKRVSVSARGDSSPSASLSASPSLCSATDGSSRRHTQSLSGFSRENPFHVHSQDQPERRNEHSSSKDHPSFSQEDAQDHPSLLESSQISAAGSNSHGGCVVAGRGRGRERNLSGGATSSDTSPNRSVSVSVQTEKRSRRRRETLSQSLSLSDQPSEEKQQRENERERRPFGLDSTNEVTAQDVKEVQPNGQKQSLAGRSRRSGDEFSHFSTEQHEASAQQSRRHDHHQDRQQTQQQSSADQSDFVQEQQERERSLPIQERDLRSKRRVDLRPSPPSVPPPQDTIPPRGSAPSASSSLPSSSSKVANDRAEGKGRRPNIPSPYFEPMKTETKTSQPHADLGLRSKSVEDTNPKVQQNQTSPPKSEKGQSHNGPPVPSPPSTTCPDLPTVAAEEEEEEQPSSLPRPHPTAIVRRRKRTAEGAEEEDEGPNDVCLSGEPEAPSASVRSGRSSYRSVGSRPPSASSNHFRLLGGVGGGASSSMSAAAAAAAAIAAATAASAAPLTSDGLQPPPWGFAALQQQMGGRGAIEYSDPLPSTPGSASNGRIGTANSEGARPRGGGEGPAMLVRSQSQTGQVSASFHQEGAMGREMNSRLPLPGRRSAHESPCCKKEKEREKDRSNRPSSPASSRKSKSSVHAQRVLEKLFETPSLVETIQSEVARTMAQFFTSFSSGPRVLSNVPPDEGGGASCQSNEGPTNTPASACVPHEAKGPPTKSEGEGEETAGQEGAVRGHKQKKDGHEEEGSQAPRATSQTPDLPDEEPDNLIPEERGRMEEAAVVITNPQAEAHHPLVQSFTDQNQKTSERSTCRHPHTAGDASPQQQQQQKHQHSNEATSTGARFQMQPSDPLTSSVPASSNHTASGGVNNLSEVCKHPPIPPSSQPPHAQRAFDAALKPTADSGSHLGPRPPFSLQGADFSLSQLALLTEALQAAGIALVHNKAAAAAAAVQPEKIPETNSLLKETSGVEPEKNVFSNRSTALEPVKMRLPTLSDKAPSEASARPGGKMETPRIALDTLVTQEDSIPPSSCRSEKEQDFTLVVGAKGELLLRAVAADAKKKREKEKQGHFRKPSGAGERSLVQRRKTSSDHSLLTPPPQQLPDAAELFAKLTSPTQKMKFDSSSNDSSANFNASTRESRRAVRQKENLPSNGPPPPRTRGREENHQLPPPSFPSSSAIGKKAKTMSKDLSPDTFVLPQQEVTVMTAFLDSHVSIPPPAAQSPLPHQARPNVQAPARPSPLPHQEPQRKDRDQIRSETSNRPLSKSAVLPVPVRTTQALSPTSREKDPKPADRVSSPLRRQQSAPPQALMAAAAPTSQPAGSGVAAAHQEAVSKVLFAAAQGKQLFEPLFQPAQPPRPPQPQAAAPIEAQPNAAAPPQRAPSAGDRPSKPAHQTNPGGVSFVMPSETLEASKSLWGLESTASLVDPSQQFPKPSKDSRGSRAKPLVPRPESGVNDLRTPVRLSTAPQRARQADRPQSPQPMPVGARPLPIGKMPSLHGPPPPMHNQSALFTSKMSIDPLLSPSQRSCSMACRDMPSSPPASPHRRGRRCCAQLHHGLSTQPPPKPTHLQTSQPPSPARPLRSAWSPVKSLIAPATVRVPCGIPPPSPHRHRALPCTQPPPGSTCCSPRPLPVCSSPAPAVVSCSAGGSTWPCISGSAEEIVRSCFASLQQPPQGRGVPRHMEKVVKGLCEVMAWSSTQKGRLKPDDIYDRVVKLTRGAAGGGGGVDPAAAGGQVPLVAQSQLLPPVCGASGPTVTRVLSPGPAKTRPQTSPHIPFRLRKLDSFSSESSLTASQGLLQPLTGMIARARGEGEPVGRIHWRGDELGNVSKDKGKNKGFGKSKHIGELHRRDDALSDSMSTVSLTETLPRQRVEKRRGKRDDEELSHRGREGRKKEVRKAPGDSDSDGRREGRGKDVRERRRSSAALSPPVRRESNAGRHDDKKERRGSTGTAKEGKRQTADKYRRSSLPSDTMQPQPSQTGRRQSMPAAFNQKAMQPLSPEKLMGLPPPLPPHVPFPPSSRSEGEQPIPPQASSEAVVRDYVPTAVGTNKRRSSQQSLPDEGGKTSSRRPSVVPPVPIQIVSPPSHPAQQMITPQRPSSRSRSPSVVPNHPSSPPQAAPQETRMISPQRPSSRRASAVPVGDNQPSAATGQQTAGRRKFTATATAPLHHHVSSQSRRQSVNQEKPPNGEPLQSIEGRRQSAVTQTSSRPAGANETRRESQSRPTHPPVEVTTEEKAAGPSAAISRRVSVAPTGGTVNAKPTQRNSQTQDSVAEAAADVLRTRTRSSVSHPSVPQRRQSTRGEGEDTRGGPEPLAPAAAETSRPASARSAAGSASSRRGSRVVPREEGRDDAGGGAERSRRQSTASARNGRRRSVTSDRVYEEAPSAAVSGALDTTPPPASFPPSHNTHSAARISHPPRAREEERRHSQRGRGRQDDSTSERSAFTASRAIHSTAHSRPPSQPVERRHSRRASRTESNVNAPPRRQSTASHTGSVPRSQGRRRSNYGDGERPSGEADARRDSHFSFSREGEGGPPPFASGGPLGRSGGGDSHSTARSGPSIKPQRPQTAHQSRRESMNPKQKETADWGRDPPIGGSRRMHGRASVPDLHAHMQKQNHHSSMSALPPVVSLPPENRRNRRGSSPFDYKISEKSRRGSVDNRLIAEGQRREVSATRAFQAADMHRPTEPAEGPDYYQPHRRASSYQPPPQAADIRPVAPFVPEDWQRRPSTSYNAVRSPSVPPDVAMMAAGRRDPLLVGGEGGRPSSADRSRGRRRTEQWSPAEAGGGRLVPHRRPSRREHEEYWQKTPSPERSTLPPPVSPFSRKTNYGGKEGGGEASGGASRGFIGRRASVGYVSPDRPLPPRQRSASRESHPRSRPPKQSDIMYSNHPHHTSQETSSEMPLLPLSHDSRTGEEGPRRPSSSHPPEPPPQVRRPSGDAASSGTRGRGRPPSEPRNPSQPAERRRHSQSYPSLFPSSPPRGRRASMAVHGGNYRRETQESERGGGEYRRRSVAVPPGVEQRGGRPQRYADDFLNPNAVVRERGWGDEQTPNFGSFNSGANFRKGSAGFFPSSSPEKDNRQTGAETDGDRIDFHSEIERERQRDRVTGEGGRRASTASSGRGGVGGGGGGGGRRLSVGGRT